MNNPFVKLTETSGGTIWINFDHVTMMWAYKTDNGIETHIAIDSEEHSTIVKQQPDYILNTLYNNNH